MAQRSLPIVVAIALLAIPDAERAPEDPAPPHPATVTRQRAAAPRAWSLADHRRDTKLSLDPSGTATLTRADGRALTLTLDGPPGEGLRGAPCPPTLAGCVRAVAVRQGDVVTTWAQGDRLEQTWTVDHPPRGTLRLRLKTAAPVTLHGGVQGSDRVEVGAFTARGLRAWDAAGTTLPARFDDDDGLAVLVDAAGAVGAVTIDPFWEGTLWWGEVRAEGEVVAFSVAGLGDLDGDGLGTVAIADVGRPAGDGPTGDQLALFHGRPGGTLVRELYAIPTSTWTGDPWQITWGGDPDGDGLGEALLLQTSGQRRLDHLVPGQGTLPVGVASEVEASAERAMTADVDGDGRVDLVVETTLRELWWAPASDPAQLTRSGAIRYVTDAGDVDGDGDDELITVDNDIVGVIPGGASGPDLAARVDVAPPLGRWTSAAVVGDLDGDGAADLVAACQGYDPVEGRSRTALHRIRAGVVEELVHDGAPTEIVRVGDATGDGLPDLLGGPNPLSFWIGAPSSFTRAPTTLPDWREDLPSQPGDTDGDGIADLLVKTAEGALLLRGGLDPLAGDDPDLLVVSARLLGASGLGDLDGDGDEELGVTTRRVAPEITSMAIYAGGPDGPASTPTWTLQADGDFDPWSAGRIGDVNGDGFDDLLLTSTAGTTLRLHLGGPAGPGAAWAWEISDPTDATLTDGRLLPGDVTGDGRADLLLRPGTRGPARYGRHELWAGDAAGLGATPAWTSEGVYSPTYAAFAVRGGDLDGDGFGDVVLSDAHTLRGIASTDGVALLHGGPAGFRAPEVVPLDHRLAWDQPWWPLAAVGDVDHDGRDDLAFSRWAWPLRPELKGRGLALWYGAPSGLVPGALTAWDNRAEGDFGQPFEVGDVNGDGRPDLGATFSGVWRGGETFALLLGGDPGLGPLPAWVAPVGTQRVTPLGDVNGDGADDLLLAPQAVLLYGGPSLPAAASCMAADDADADGVCAPNDADDADARTCRDADRDGCDDCASGRFDPAADGPDADGDGLCADDDPDRDGDGASDLLDQAPDDGSTCGDHDGDGCDDCDHGAMSVADDGANHDADHRCDAADPDDDNDGVADAEDADPVSGTRCGLDLDADGCDDCGSGALDLIYDGPDLDLNGRCSVSDPWEGVCLGEGRILAVGPVTNARLGAHVAYVGDVDADGLPDVAAAGLHSRAYWDYTWYGHPSWSVLARGDGSTLRLPDEEVMPAYARGRGDADGDGLDDILLGVPTDYYAETSVLGGSWALLTHGATTVGWRRSAGDGTDRRLSAVWLGDIDHDGFDDFATLDPAAPDPVQPDTGFWIMASSTVQVWHGSAAGPTPGALWWFLGHGTGSWPDTPWDVDHDGFDDLVLLSYDAVWMLPGIEDGFGEPTQAASLSPWGLGSDPQPRHADVTGDGWTDLVVADGDTWLTFPGGPGGLASSPLQALDLADRYRDWAWALADVDGDRLADLVITSPQGDRAQGREGLLRWYRATADGFETSPAGWFSPDLGGAQIGADLEVADLDDDGELDLILGGSLAGSGAGAVFTWPLSVLRSVESLTAWRQTTEGSLGEWFDVADHDGDGVDDLVVQEWLLDQDRHGTWHRGVAAGPALPGAPVLSTFSTAAGVGDLDGDGYADLIAHGYPTDTIARSGPSGPDTAEVPGIPWGLIAGGDLDGDGYDDLIPWQGGTGDLTATLSFGGPGAILGTAPWYATRPPSIALNDEPRLMAVPDVDHDGDDELAVLLWVEEVRWPTQKSVQISLYAGGPGGPATTPMWSITGEPAAQTDAQITSGDVDGDGWPDLILTTPDAPLSWSQGTVEAAFEGAGSVRIWAGGPAGPTDRLLASYAGDAHHQRLGRSLHAADVDGDGVDDLVLGFTGQRQGGGGALVLRGGPGGPAPTPLWVGTCEMSEADVDVGDLNGDGLADLVLVTASSNGGGSIHLRFGSANGPVAELPPPAALDTGAEPTNDTPAAGDTDVAPADTDAVPADTVPADTVPADTVPADSDTIAVDTDTEPADTVPADTVPADSDTVAVDTDTLPTGDTDPAAPNGPQRPNQRAFEPAGHPAEAEPRPPRTHPLPFGCATSAGPGLLPMVALLFAARRRRSVVVARRSAP